MLTYLPSGWLADRVAPRRLVVFSLVAMGLLGIWFSTLPAFPVLLIIFAGWGIVTGLTFWAALIKAVAVLGHHREQGRFFGILEGGRGLVEAILASVAVYLFNRALADEPTSMALAEVIYLYVAFALLLAPIVYFAIDDGKGAAPAAERVTGKPGKLKADLGLILANRDIWLVAFCILCGYQLFWATYSFSGYLFNIYGLTAVAGAWITVAKLWMRPIGPIVAGFAADRFEIEKTLAWLMFAGSASLAALMVVPATAGAAILVTVVLIIGLMTYAIRGIFWATLDSCNIPLHTKGLAIGVISLVGYSPDIYLPLINGWLLEAFPGKTGYSLYFGGIVLMGILGTMAAWRLHLRVQAREE